MLKVIHVIGLQTVAHLCPIPLERKKERKERKKERKKERRKERKTERKKNGKNERKKERTQDLETTRSSQTVPRKPRSRPTSANGRDVTKRAIMYGHSVVFRQNYAMLAIIIAQWTVIFSPCVKRVNFHPI